MQIETVLRTAETVLEKKNKFDSAITQSVSELQGLIVARLETERTFQRAEAAVAIGEPAADLQKAKTAAAHALAALDQASLKLNGFRTALCESGSPLVESSGVSTFSTRSVLIPLLQQVNRRPHCASVYIECY